MPHPTPLPIEIIKPILDVNDYISIAAIFLGPIVGIQLQKFLEARSASSGRRESIFKTLMATRGTTLSTAHVEALNSIDLEFSQGGKKFQKVLSAWNEYFDHLNSPYGESGEGRNIWLNSSESLLINMLFEMSQALGYSFDRALIRRHSYSPVGHGKSEQQAATIRAGLAKLLDSNEGYLTVYNVVDEDIAERQAELHQLMINYYTPNPSRSTEQQEPPLS